MRRDEDSLGMLGGEESARPGRAGLEQERRALRAWVSDVRAGHVEELALVVYLPYQLWVGVYSLFAVQPYGIVPPGRLEELVYDLEVLLRLGVTVIVLTRQAAG